MFLKLALPRRSRDRDASPQGTFPRGPTALVFQNRPDRSAFDVQRCPDDCRPVARLRPVPLARWDRLNDAEAAPRCLGILPLTLTRARRDVPRVRRDDGCGEDVCSRPPELGDTWTSTVYVGTREDRRRPPQTLPSTRLGEGNSAQM